MDNNRRFAFGGIIDEDELDADDSIDFSGLPEGYMDALEAAIKSKNTMGELKEGKENGSTDKIGNYN